MALIETFNLGKAYGERQALQDVNLKVDRGDVLALIGPTGAGKTTLLRLLDLLEQPTSGSLLFDGLDITRYRHHRLEVRRRISFVQQKPVMFELNVYDNIACGLKWRRKRGKTIEQMVTRVLELVDLLEYKDRDARTLSGGEAQRVAIARAIATQPELLMLDEPTANLDPFSSSKIERLLKGIIKEQGTTVIVTTHDMSQGQHLASRIGVLIKGKLLQVGSPNEIFNSPRNREVAEFVGIENILSGVIVAKDDGLETIRVNDSVIIAISDYDIGGNVSVLVRPEDIVFTISEEASSARNSYVGTVTRIVDAGPLVRITVDCGFCLLGVATKRSTQELEITVGKQVYVGFNVTAVHVTKRWE